MSGLLERARGTADAVQERLQRTLIWGAWERMLETEFVDRSVALAGKAFVSFFPLVDRGRRLHAATGSGVDLRHR